MNLFFRHTGPNLRQGIAEALVSNRRRLAQGIQLCGRFADTGFFQQRHTVHKAGACLLCDIQYVERLG